MDFIVVLVAGDSEVELRIRKVVRDKLLKSIRLPRHVILLVSIGHRHEKTEANQGLATSVTKSEKPRLKARARKRNLMSSSSARPRVGRTDSPERAWCPPALRWTSPSPTAWRIAWPGKWTGGSRTRCDPSTGSMCIRGIDRSSRLR